MPEVFDLLDRLVRRNRLLPRATWLRNALRGPYHRLMNLQKRGLPLVIGGAMPVRLPAEFCAKELEEYEVESAKAIATWVEQHPGGLFVDIGCSYGFFSCGALFADGRGEVIGIDADLPSLAITRRVCELAPDADQRLELYRALIGPDSKSASAIVEIKQQTEQALADPALQNVSPGKTNYVNLDTQIDETELPRVSLDTFLIPRLAAQNAPCLVKCDVEGAEQVVLEGANELMREHKPTLLISVHPPYLPKFGSSVEAIRQLLTNHGYTIDIIGIDHEEHWLCQ